MAEIRCVCGNTTRYADDMEDVLSCPHCGETLADLRKGPARLPTTHMRDDGKYPSPLSDPLRVFRTVLGTFVFLAIVASAILLLFLSARDMLLFVVALVGFVIVLWFPLSVWLILPGRRVNAFYLRSFTKDPRTLFIRQDAQNALGRNFRLSGIRDPRRRWPPIVRWLLPWVLVFRYSTPKYMNLEAGNDWKGRLWRSLADARCALIDVTDITPFVLEEIELCRQCLGMERILFVGDDTRDTEEWKEHLCATLPMSLSRESIHVAVWSPTPEGRKAFRDRVNHFATYLPTGTAGLAMSALSLTQSDTLPDEPAASGGGIFFGGLEVGLGLVLALGVCVFTGFLPQLGAAGAIAYWLFPFVLQFLFLWAFVRYLIDWGPGPQRRFALAAIGAPTIGVVALTAAAIGLLVPATAKVREAAERTTAQNQFKEISYAMHTIGDRTRSLPPYAIRHPKTGQPLLSWRVAILPALGQGNLYDQIRRDEPWDSDHNRQFWSRMPRVYQHPRKPSADGKTYFQVFVGNESVFPKTQAVKFGQITDGTSNTLMVVEAADPVPWMAPEDIPFAMNDTALMDRVGNHWSGGMFVGVFCDGTTRALSRDMPHAKLQALITRAGSEPVSLDW